MVVTIDGPAGSGKSTTARLVAERLGWLYLDTGAMYRALALKVLKKGISLEDAERISQLAKEVKIELVPSPQGLKVFLDGEEVTKEIRTPEVDRAVSPVCEIKAVRDVLARLQRKFGEKGDLVTDGRDQGTVVFPDADVKFYLTASLEERAKRRKKDQEGKGIFLSMEEVIRGIKERDRRDSEREHSPLRPAEDAIVVDTTHMSIEEQVEYVLTVIRQKRDFSHGTVSQ